MKIHYKLNFRFMFCNPVSHCLSFRLRKSFWSYPIFTFFVTTILFTKGKPIITIEINTSFKFAAFTFRCFAHVSSLRYNFSSFYIIFLNQCYSIRVDRWNNIVFILHKKIFIVLVLMYQSTVN